MWRWLGSWGSLTPQREKIVFFSDANIIWGKNIICRTFNFLWWSWVVWREPTGAVCRWNDAYEYVFWIVVWFKVVSMSSECYIYWYIDFSDVFTEARVSDGLDLVAMELIHMRIECGVNGFCICQLIGIIFNCTMERSYILCAWKRTIHRGLDVNRKHAVDK